MQELLKEEILAFSRRITQAHRNGRTELAARLCSARISLIDHLKAEHQIRTVLHKDGSVEFSAAVEPEAA